MGCLGNIIWLLCGGFISGILWMIYGIMYCITVIGIPLGLQCFKFASLSMCPFGKSVEFGSGNISIIANIIWICFTGLEMAIGYAVAGAILYLTVIGIPFGKQYFKLAKLALMPFGANVTM